MEREVYYFRHYLMTTEEREAEAQKLSVFAKTIKLTKDEPIQLYDKVKLLNLTDQLQLSVTIVPDEESNTFEGKYGEHSSFGEAILGNHIMNHFYFDEADYKIISATGKRK